MRKNILEEESMQFANDDTGQIGAFVRINGKYPYGDCAGLEGQVIERHHDTLSDGFHLYAGVKVRFSEEVMKSAPLWFQVLRPGTLERNLFTRYLEVIPVSPDQQETGGLLD